MKTRIATLLSVLALLAVSCEQDPDEGAVWGNPKFVRVVAPTEVVKSGSTELEIFYKEGQLIKVWEQAGNAVDLKTNKDKDSVFFSYDWIPDAVPAYAAFPSTEKVTCNAGVFEVEVETEQKVSASGDIENFVAVGRITGANRQSYKVSPIRHVTGFVKLAFGLSDIKSITLETLGGEPLTGKVSVDCERLEKNDNEWITVVNGGSSVTVRPVEEGGLLGAGAYYASILPGYYSQGFKVTVNYKNGQPFEKVYGGTGLTVSRSAVLDLDVNQVDSELIERLPDDIRIDLDFSNGWPFVEEIVSAARQEETEFAQDTYSYIYGFEHDGIPQEFAVRFMIKSNKKAYLHKDGTLQPGNAWSNMVFPAIPEHYLRAVRLAVKNSAGKTYLVNDYKTGVRLLDWTVPATKESPSTLSFPTEDGIVPALATSYKISFKEVNTLITDMSLLYSRELPSEYDGNPFGDETVEPEPPTVPEPDLPEDFSITLDFESGWPFSTPIAEVQAKGGETYAYTLQIGEKKVDVPVVVDGNGVSYSMKDNTCLYLNVANAKIPSPVFSDRYLTRVQIEKTAASRMRWPDGSAGGWSITSLHYSLYTDKTLLEYVQGSELKNTEFTEVTAVKDKSYDLVKTVEGNISLKKVVFTYSSTSPGMAPAATAAE